jgi:hypothetical protein
MPCSYDFNQFSVTGDCENNGSGGFTLYLSSTSEPMSITWLLPDPWSPNGGDTIQTPIYNGTYEYLNLSAGTYVFTINDSCGSPTATTENNRETISITVSSGTSCVNIGEVVNTICGQENGSLEATVANSNGTVTYRLYLENNDNRVEPIPAPPNEPQDPDLIRIIDIDSNSYVFENLPYGIYYVIANDGGGCTGRSENVIIQTSVNINYGVYVVNDADCGNVSTGVGKILITGLTGVPPYTYLWAGVSDPVYLISTGQPLTGSSITGLTAGFYSILITDSNGCQLSTTVEITEKQPVSIATIESVPPTCFDANGSITVTVINGTGPYRYTIPSIPITDISYSQTYTFNNLPGGFYQVFVTDAALCSDNEQTQVNQSNSFAIGRIITTPPTCGNSNGSITANIVGNVNSDYTYTISGSNGTVDSVIGSLVKTFPNLSPQTYLLTISDGFCTYTNVYDLSSSSLFTLTTSVTGATCGNNNGSVTITKSTGGTPQFIFSIQDTLGTNNQSYTNTPFSSNTFYNLASGSYIGLVEDGGGCGEYVYFDITESENVYFILIPTDSTNGSNGQILANIVQGTPPFTLTWSSNVNGQTGSVVTNLSAGTYTLTVEDSAGCVLSNSIVLQGNYVASNFSVYNICDSIITSTDVISERTLGKMLVEGYIDLTSGCTNCLMNSAIFSAVTTVAGSAFTQSFYTATTLNTVPSESLWASTVQTLLSGVTGVGTVTVNTTDNTITVDTDCEESTNGLANQNIVVQLKIVYDIDCESC